MSHVLNKYINLFNQPSYEFVVKYKCSVGMINFFSIAHFNDSLIIYKKTNKSGVWYLIKWQKDCKSRLWFLKTN